MRRMLMVAVACSLVLVACGGDEAPTATEEQDQVEQDQVEEEGAATVATADSEFGTILVDADGNTLYMFVPDEQEGEPTCYDDCAATWPALEAIDEPTAGDGLEASLLGTVERTDGSTQVTYNDLTLYLFAGDDAPGDTNGQGLNDVWWVVSAEGEPVME